MSKYEDLVTAFREGFSSKDAERISRIALRVMREPSSEMTEAMASEAAAIRRRSGYVQSYRDLYQAGIDAELARRGEYVNAVREAKP